MRVLFMFGMDDDGQCGNRLLNSGFADSVNGDYSELTFNCTPTLVHFPIPISVHSVSTGSRHTLALSSEGVVYSWGWGKQGQLGLGHYNSVIRPARIEFPQILKVGEISAGGIHSACVDINGQCYSWGGSSYGQLGLGIEAAKDLNRNFPVKVSFSLNCLSNIEVNKSDAIIIQISKIACGGMHTAAVDINGEIWAWGRTDNGQAGSMECNGNLYIPSKLKSFSNRAIDVKCGGFHTMILTDVGTVYSLGKEDFGLLGVGSYEGMLTTGQAEPLCVKSLLSHRVTKISCGGWHNLFVTESLELYACGKGEYGRLGLGENIEQSKDEPCKCIFSNENSYRTGSSSSSKNNNNKNNRNYNDNDRESDSDMMVIARPFKVVNASAGGSHSMALLDDGSVYVTGRTDSGRLGLGPPIVSNDRIHSFTLLRNPMEHVVGSKVVDISAGGSHSAIIVEIQDFDFVDTIG